MPLVGESGFKEADYITDSGNFNAWKYYLQNLPSIIGRWIGRGVSSYTEASTEFERDWNSYENQMQQQAAAGINPYEGFSQLSGNQVSTGSVDPMVQFGSYMQGLLDLGQGLADLRAKRIANQSSYIDLLRKQFENKWFFGNPGSITTEVVDGPNGPEIVTSRQGYIEPLPQIDYDSRKYNRNSARYRQPSDKYLGMVSQHKLDQGYYIDEANSDRDSKYWSAYDTEYRAKRDKLSYEWENFLKNELGLDPRTSPWITSLLSMMNNHSKSDTPFGRFLFGVLQFLKGNY